VANRAARDVSKDTRAPRGESSDAARNNARRQRGRSRCRFFPLPARLPHAPRPKGHGASFKPASPRRAIRRSLGRSSDSRHATHRLPGLGGGPSVGPSSPASGWSNRPSLGSIRHSRCFASGPLRRRVRGGFSPHFPFHPRLPVAVARSPDIVDTKNVPTLAEAQERFKDDLRPTPGRFRNVLPHQDFGKRKAARSVLVRSPRWSTYSYPSCIEAHPVMPSLRMA